MMTDVVATILASYDVTADGLIPGQPFRGTDHDDPQLLALDRSQAAAIVDSATVPALGSWLALGVIGLVICLVRPSRGAGGSPPWAAPSPRSPRSPSPSDCAHPSCPGGAGSTTPWH